MSDDLWFERLAEASGGELQERAPARLASKIYSALVSRLAESGPLLDLSQTQADGGRLCVFESAVAVVARGTQMCSMNPCRICHARVLGERMNNAPILWPGCPYSEFHKG